MEKQTLTIKEAAEKYSLNDGHLRRLCCKGILPAKKHGTKMWIITNIAAFERALNARPQKGKYDRKKKKRR